jgi:hypothetical protein
MCVFAFSTSICVMVSRGAPRCVAGCDPQATTKQKPKQKQAIGCERTNLRKGHASTHLLIRTIREETSFDQPVYKKRVFVCLPVDQGRSWNKWIFLLSNFKNIFDYLPFLSLLPSLSLSLSLSWSLALKRPVLHFGGER